MSTSQTLLSMAAMMFLSTILLGFYRLLAGTGDDISSGQDGILATTISTSYMEVAHGLAFDTVTDSSDIAINNVSVLTAPASLGRDHVSEDSLHNFDDFDDFHGFTADKEAPGTGRRYRTMFKVYYANATSVGQNSTSRTFLKRLDLKTWRIAPPATGGAQLDTVKMSTVLGYFHFD
ncbi:MAG: hypothetical protein ACKVRP_14920 [Bacteroidota bacterium]